MILGPIVPRTGDGLAQVVCEAPHRLEGGLAVVQERLVLGDGVVIDLLARDAIGRAVLLILAAPGDDRDVPARLADALAWFDEHALALRGVMRQHGVRLDLPARAIVACFDLGEGTARRVREIGARFAGDDGAAGDRVAVLRLEPFELGGERHVGVVPVLDSGRPGGGAVDDLPPAMLDLPEGALARAFVHKLSRLDPELVVDGDRYGRFWAVGSGDVAGLRRRGRALEVLVPGFDPLSLAEERDVPAAIDRVARHFLELVGEHDEGEHVDPLEMESGFVAVQELGLQDDELQGDELIGSTGDDRNADAGETVARSRDVSAVDVGGAG